MPEQTEVPSRVLAGLWWLTVAVFALHNAEEYLRDLPAWALVHAPAGIASAHGGQAGFGIAAALLTVAALVVAGQATVARPGWSTEVLVCFAFVLILNAGSHLAFSALTGTLMPGVLTAPLLMALGVYLVWRLPRVRATWPTVLVTVVVAVAATAGALLLGGLLTG
ncbi:MAG TPA: HXXEE domain-containing protein [Nocardiopsis listeri]|uniref:HXXEE domain-containing protein n=1 Tax=Nocardiopsis listeri TaxID=53440 RepID=UPI001D9AF18C|nr:HXXEE domain-containing protein [Nocardiopsis listeri]HJE57134.1 HXXEE domain-containing protein [Nocardiopsis listeri]